MRLDIERLKEIHPMMPAETAAERAHLGALALQRHHESGVVTQVRFETASHEATLHWTRRADTDAGQVDPRRMIEDGAEAVALSLVHAARGWASCVGSCKESTLTGWCATRRPGGWWRSRSAGRTTATDARGCVRSSHR